MNQNKSNSTKITNPRGQVTRYTYNAISQRTGMTYPNGMTASYAYDAAGQLLSLVYKMGANTIASFVYSYDYKGNRIRMDDEYGTHRYTYDKVNQLTQATHPQANNPTENYAYDPVGNRLGNTFNAGNRLLEDANYIYSYNRDGNTVWKKDKITGKVFRYTYNAIRELTDVKKYASETDTTPITSARYYYDALRRRIAKRVNGVLTRYVYSNEAIIQELNESGTQLAYYTHGPSIDEPISIERGGIAYYYIADGLGSIVKLVDASGNVVNSYVYDSFGNMVSKTEAVTNYYTYTSREYDSESSLYYYRMRYYDPLIGRFMNHDPMGLSQGLNLYAYAINNPIKYVDSFGLWCSQPGFEGHYDLTYNAAVATGWASKSNGWFAPPSSSELMAKSSNLVDDIHGDIYHPDEKAWHFYVDTADASREIIKKQFEKAVLAEKAGNCIDVITNLGYGLHTLQDKYSHYEKGAVYGESLWKHVNYYDNPNDPNDPYGRRALFNMAESASVEYLNMFNLARGIPSWAAGIAASLDPLLQ